MTQNDEKIGEINDKKDTKSSILDTVLGIKAQKEANLEKEAIKIKESPENKIKDLTDSLQRLQAEFENYQKRNARQNDEFRIFANAKLIEDFLPVLDSLEQGMQHSKDLVILYEQINGILKKKGLEKIQLKKGMKFDHDEMECLMQETDNKLPPDAVVNVLMNGYKLNGKILRLARVSVNTLEKKCVDAVEVKKEASDIDSVDAMKNEKGKNKEKVCEVKEKNEHDGMTKCDFEIKIMESN